MTTYNLFLMALVCSGVKPNTIAKHFQMPEIRSVDGFQQADETLQKRILGFLINCCTAKYGICKKKGTPEGFPHLLVWNELVSGAADLNYYEEVFVFLSQQTVKQTMSIKPKPQIKLKSGIKKQALIKKQKLDEEEPENMPKSTLSKLIKTQKGKRFSGYFTCMKCFNKHSSGYIFTDEEGHEYEVCSYCCRKKNDLRQIIYTPMGNRK